MKDLLKLLDLSREEIVRILDVADQMKYDQKHRLPHPRLQGKTLAMIFEKNSTRTRVSFENGMFQLGGHALFLSGRESQIGRGEPVAGRPHDHPGAQGQAGGAEDVLHRRRQQHGQLPHRGLPEGGHGGVRGLPRGL